MGGEGTDIEFEDEASGTEDLVVDRVEIESYHAAADVDPTSQAQDDEPAPVPVDEAEPIQSDYPYEHRLAERKNVRVKAVVQIREDDGNTWKEIIEIGTVSKNGCIIQTTSGRLKLV